MGLGEPEGVVVKWEVSDLRSLKGYQSLQILENVSRLEKKTFAANEAFDFGPRLLKQANARVYVAYSVTPGKSTLVGYAVAVNHKRTLLLHKMCVAGVSRRQGIGRLLMSTICGHAKGTSCVAIQLWVASSNLAARALYTSFGFEESSVVINYYCPGRSGVQMLKEMKSDSNTQAQSQPQPVTT